MQRALQGVMQREVHECGAMTWLFAGAQGWRGAPGCATVGPSRTARLPTAVARRRGEFLGGFSMAARFPLGKNVCAITLSDPRPREEWVDDGAGGRRPSGQRVVDESGRPVSTVELLCVSDITEPRVVQADLPDDLVAGITLGSMAILKGRVFVDVTSRRDSRQLSQYLGGVESVTPIPQWASACDWAAEVIDNVA